jgi:RNA polymerase sigma-54 factor
MALTQRLDLRQTQALVMTPQLQQAIKLLQLSNIELTQFIEAELEQNPLLERDESDPDRVREEAAPEPAPEVAAAPEAIDSAAIAGEAAELWRAEGGEEGGGDQDFAGDPDAWAPRTSGDSNGDYPALEQTASHELSLRDHLLAQVSMDLDDPADKVIAAHLIDLLDEAGYLVGDLTAVAERLGCDVERIEATLKRVQRFDPAGVFARTLAECLALQLR